MKTNTRLTAMALAAALLLSSCATLSVPVPEGFAVTEKPGWKGGERFSALSPEGIRFRVRTVENYPEKDIAFWKAALETHLKNKGYQQTGADTSFTSGGKAGVAFEWGLPYGEENDIYLTAIVVYPGKILIAEAAGEAGLYAGYREALRESIRGMTLR